MDSESHARPSGSEVPPPTNWMPTPPPHQETPYFGTPGPVPPPAPQARPKSRRVVVFAIAATFVVAAVSGGIGYAIGSQNSNEKEVASPTATSSTTSEAALSTPLTAADFTLAVLVEEKACFGSAGCNLQVSITPTFLGSTSDLVGRTFKVLYEIAGGEEPILERFTIEGGSFSHRRDDLSANRVER